MGKYIVELKKNETLYKAATRESDGTAYVCSAIGTPYTEPDLDAIRKESYDKCMNEAEDLAYKLYSPKIDEAYQRGLNDAWEAARKIGSNSMCSLKEMGFDFGQCVFNDYNPSWYVVKNYSASECIEKIRAYEQEKDEGSRLRRSIKNVMSACDCSLDDIAEALQKMKKS